MDERVFLSFARSCSISHDDLERITKKSHEPIIRRRSYMKQLRPKRARGQTWKTFLRHHVAGVSGVGGL